MTSKKRRITQGALTRILNTTDHLRRTWKEVIENPDDWRKTPVKLGADEVLVDGVEPDLRIDEVELFTKVNAETHLGPVPRLMIVCDYLIEQSVVQIEGTTVNRAHVLKEAFNLMAAQSGKQGSDNLFRNHSDRLSPTRPTKFANKREWPQIEEGLVALLHRHHRVENVFSVQDVFRDPFFGKDAIDQFARYIQRDTRYVPKTPLTYVAQALTRGTVLKDTLRWISDDALPGEPHLRPMLINIHGAGRWRDLAAFSQKLEAELNRPDTPMEDHKKVFRIPLARYAQKPQENPGTQSGAFQHTMSFDDVLYRLGQAFDVLDASAPRDTARALDASQIIRDIKIKLADDPHVIIFEGYYEAPEKAHGAEMLRVVRDDHLMHLLLRLMEPPIADYQHPKMKRSGRPLDIATFRKSRFVVLSNRELSYFNEGKSPASQTDVLQKELPAPNHGELEEILERCTLPHRDMLLTAFTGGIPALAILEYEPLFDLLDAHLTLLCALGERDNGTVPGLSPQEHLQALFEEEDLPANANGPSFLRWLMKRHLLALKDLSEPVFQLHLYVALIPCGLRHISLMRIARRMRSMAVARDGKDRTVPLNLLFSADTLPRIDVIATQTAGSLLTDNQSDVFEAFDAAPDLFESIILPGSDERRQTGYDFHDPIMKEAAADVLQELGTLDATDIMVLHRSLSDEALCQQTVALTHGGTNYLTSIRALRRQISGIYHGFLSLPVVKKKNQIKLDDSFFVYSSYLAGPQSNQEYFEWVYFFVFRRMVERPPAWNLGRHYALDRLKLDILEAADRPWSLAGSVNKKYGAASLLRAMYKDGQPDLIEDHLVNYTHALTGLSDVQEAHALQQRRDDNEFTLAPPPPALHLKRLKDRLDIHILRTHDPLDTCWSAFWNTIDQTAAELGTTGQKEAFTKDRIDDQIDKATNFLFDKFQRTISPPGDSYWEGNHYAFATQVFNSVQNDAVMAAICDNLYRLSEYTAVEADLLRSAPLLKNLKLGNKYARLKIEELSQRARQTAGEDDLYREFCKALAIYDFAETIRLQIFQRNPGGSQFFASAHAARAGIRTSLILEREARKRRFANFDGYSTIPNEMWLGYFSQKARRICERVSKHTFRYPRERASLMIIESSILRMMSETPAASNVANVVTETPNLQIRRRALEAAQHYLADAEGIISTLSRRNRVRMRLSLERAKVNAALAPLAPDPKDRDRHIALSDYDVSWLERAAAPVDLVQWKIIAGLARNKLSTQII